MNFMAIHIWTESRTTTQMLETTTRQTFMLFLWMTYEEALKMTVKTIKKSFKMSPNESPSTVLARHSMI
jgi:hypothetical protein